MDAQPTCSLEDQTSSLTANVKQRPPRSLASRLFRSGIWAIVGRLGAMALFLLNYHLICQILPPSEVSVYVVTFGVVSLMSLFAGLGLPMVALRLISKFLVEKKGATPLKIFMKMSSLILGATLVVQLVAAGVMAWFPETLGKPLFPLVVPILIWISVRTASTVVSETLRGLHSFALAAMIGGQQGGLISNFALGLCIFFGRESITQASHLIWIQVLLTAVALFLFSLLCIRQLINHSQSFKSTESGDHDVRSLLKESLKVLVSQLSIFGVIEYETVLIGANCSDVETAAWGAIRRLIAIVSAPLLLMNAAIPSFIAELHARREVEKLERLLRLVSTMATPPALLAFGFAWLVGPWVLSTFNEQFVSAWLPLVYLTAANVIFVVSGSAGLALQMTNRQGWMTLSSVLLMVIYVIIAPTIIERYELLGAAILAAVLIVIRNLISTILVREAIGIWCIPTLDLKDIKLVFSRRPKQAVASTDEDMQ